MSHCTNRVLYSILTVDFICFCGYVYNMIYIYIHCYIYFHPIVSWWSLSYCWWCKRSCTSWDWDIWYILIYDIIWHPGKNEKFSISTGVRFLPSTLCLTLEDRMPRLAMGHSLGAKLQAARECEDTHREKLWMLLFLGCFFLCDFFLECFVFFSMVFCCSFPTPLFFTSKNHRVGTLQPTHHTVWWNSAVRRSCFAASGPIPCFRGWHSLPSITLEWKTRRERTSESLVQSVDYCRMKFGKKMVLSVCQSIAICVDIVFS